MCDTAARREKRQIQKGSGEKGKGNKNDNKRTKSGSQNSVCGSSNRRTGWSDGCGTDDV